MCRSVTLHFACLHIREHTCPSIQACNTIDLNSIEALTHEVVYRFVRINTECWDCAANKARNPKSHQSGVHESDGGIGYNDENDPEAMAIDGEM